MSKKDKLIAKLKSNPKDFTFDEMQNLLELLGFKVSNKGKTSGSRVRFMKNNIPVNLHKPHPRNELKAYQIKQVIKVLEKENLI
jgi:predicted RNA binding protein YcfA (HicA-like mRNA interferase family)